MINSWSQLIEAQLEGPELPSGHNIWIASKELRPRMTPKFGRRYDRSRRRLTAEWTQRELVMQESRQYVQVVARKRRTRKRKRR